jgi:hypothetical protein
MRSRMGIIDFENIECANRELIECRDFVSQLRRPVFANPYVNEWNIPDEAEKVVGWAICKAATPAPEGEEISYSWQWAHKKIKGLKKTKKTTKATV